MTIYFNDKGIPHKASEAIHEQENIAAYEICGDTHVSNIKPIEECCAKCTHWNYRNHFKTTKDCQIFQKKEGKENE